MLDQQVFQAELLKDETILWTGRPDPSIHFTVADIPFILFFLFWEGFAIFTTATMFFSEARFFSMLGMIFVCIGLYMIFDRFVLPAWRKKRTYYAVTDKRVLALTTTGVRTLQTWDIHTLPGVQTWIRRNGTGTITFGDPGGTGRGITFYDIQDVQQVYELVNDIRRRLSY